MLIIFGTTFVRPACELWPKLDFPKSAIKSVALTTQRATIINLDSEGKPLRPAIVWLDQRLETNLPSMGLWSAPPYLAGEKDAVSFFRSQAEANWIKNKQPQIWDKTAKYLLLSGYLTYKLTGKYVDSVASQVGYLPFDFKRHDWAGPLDWKWRALPIKRRAIARTRSCRSATWRNQFRGGDN